MILVERESELSTLLDFQEVMVQGEPIGIGGYGKVYAGKWRQTDVAVKILKDQSLSGDEMKEFKREIDLMNMLRHPNIVNFIGAVVIPGKLCIVTEYLKLGSLQDLIDSKKKMNNLLKAKVASDIAKGMSFLHSSGILHRDLKPDNVLVVSTSARAELNAKLTDFGTSRIVSRHSSSFNYTKMIGSPIYMAPEILMREEYSEKADVYSFAMVLYAMLIQDRPYFDFEFTWAIAQFVTQGRRLSNLPENSPHELVDIVQISWAQNPDDRKPFNEIAQMLQVYIERKTILSKTRNEPYESKSRRLTDIDLDILEIEEHVEKNIKDKFPSHQTEGSKNSSIPLANLIEGYKVHRDSTELEANEQEMNTLNESVLQTQEREESASREMNIYLLESQSIRMVPSGLFDTEGRESSNPLPSKKKKDW